MAHNSWLNAHHVSAGEAIMQAPAFAVEDAPDKSGA
jgi:hypothetical protein